MYDAIVVLGGSFIDKDTLPTWVIGRLDYAITKKNDCKCYILCSRGTTHKPPELDDNGFPYDECKIMANYMIKKGILPDTILLDSWSLDTIGNAYAVLLQHCIPNNMRKLHIVTSDFHMPRSKSIFCKVFSLFPLDVFNLSFCETKSELAISNKEAQSLNSWIERSESIYTLKDLHKFINLEHRAYMFSNNVQINNFTKEELKMYCI